MALKDSIIYHSGRDTAAKNAKELWSKSGEMFTPGKSLQQRFMALGELCVISITQTKDPLIAPYRIVRKLITGKGTPKK